MEIQKMKFKCPVYVDEISVGSFLTQLFAPKEAHPKHQPSHQLTHTRQFVELQKLLNILKTA